MPDGSTRLRPWFGGALEFHVTEMEEQAVAWSVGRAAEEAPIRAAIGLEDQRSGSLLARPEQHQRLRLLEIARHRMEVVVGQAIDMLQLQPPLEAETAHGVGEGHFPPGPPDRGVDVHIACGVDRRPPLLFRAVRTEDQLDKCRSESYRESRRANELTQATAAWA